MGFRVVNRPNLRRAAKNADRRKMNCRGAYRCPCRFRHSRQCGRQRSTQEIHDPLQHPFSAFVVGDVAAVRDEQGLRGALHTGGHDLELGFAAVFVVLTLNH